VWWRNCDDKLSRFYTIPERDGQTDGQTELLYQYHAIKRLYVNFHETLLSKIKCRWSTVIENLVTIVLFVLSGNYCRLKAYIVMGRKINLSGISPVKRSRSGPNSVYINMSRGDNVQVILGIIGPFWAKLGLGRVPRSANFVCGKLDNLSATLQRPISTKFGRVTHFGVPSRNPERQFRKFSL